MFTLCDDFNEQQIPFSIALHNALEGGGLSGWTWNYDLGMSTIQGFSFYALGSPFYWLTLLFPASCFPYLVGWLFILKYIVAGATAYLYLRRFVNNPLSAVAAAVLYAFSGFQTANIEFYHFHDVVAFFPLLLIGLENAMEDKGSRIFIFAVFINCLTNYYFFVSEVVFLVFYFLFRFWTGDLGLLLRRVGKCLVCGLLGVGMAAVLFLPSAIFILNNHRSHPNMYLDSLVPKADDFLMIIKGFLFPGEAMNDRSCVEWQSWTSVEANLPMVAIVPVLAYCGKERNWLSRLILFLSVISFFPLFSSVFLLFSENSYRWWFMLILLMALASSKVFDCPERYDIRRAGWIDLAAVAVFSIMVGFVKYNEGDYLVVHRARTLLYIAIAVAGVVSFELLFRRNRPDYRLLVLGIMGFSILTTGIAVAVYRGMDYDAEETVRLYELGTQLDRIDDQYRYDLGDNRLTFTGDAAGVYVFSSTYSNSSREFERLFDYQMNHRSLPKSAYYGLTELLGGRFCVIDGNEAETALREYTIGGFDYSVVEKAACPIGFAVDHYILAEDLMSIDNSEKSIALMNAAVIYPEAEEKILSVASRISADAMDLTEDIEAVIARDAEAAVSNFSRDNRGFSCSSSYDRDSLVFFSVPFDPGWTVLIDGCEAEAVNSAGMMLLVVPAGRHDIRFSYCTPGFTAGWIISSASAAVFLLYALCSSLKKRRLHRGSAAAAEV